MRDDLPPGFATLLLKNPDNLQILNWLGIHEFVEVTKVKRWVDTGFEPGAQRLFVDLGRRVSGTLACVAGIQNLLVRADNGAIVATHVGRYSFFVRHAESQPNRALRITTLDGCFDLSPLEARWASESFEDAEESLALLQAATEAMGQRS